MTTAATEDVIPYQKAKKIADRVYELLEPHCDIIHIAGSVRRGLEKDWEGLYVKDVEIVCLPKKVFVETDLFGGGSNRVCPAFITAIHDMAEEILKGSPHSGRYVKMILKGGVKLDLFTPQPDDYYRQLAIRTGSKEYAHKVIANGWTALGWVGTDHGLRRKKDCFPITDKKSGKPLKWALNNPSGEIPPVWKSEKEFFEWLGVRWIEPKYR